MASPSMNVLDSDTLSRIFPFVYDWVFKSSSLNPPQIILTTATWRQAIPIWSSSRQFRNAFFLVIGCLDDMSPRIQAVESGNDHPFQLRLGLPLSTALEFKALREIYFVDVDFTGNTLPLIQKMESLKVIHLHFLNEELHEEIEAFPAFRKLRVLSLYSVKCCTAAQFFKFPYEKLEILDIASNSHIPQIPRSVFETIREFLWNGKEEGILGASNIRSLARAPNLQVLILSNINSQDLEQLDEDGGFENVISLTIKSTTPQQITATFPPLINAFERGYFPAVEEMFIDYLGVSHWDRFMQLLEKCKATVTVLDIYMKGDLLADEHVESMMLLNLREDLEFHLFMSVESPWNNFRYEVNKLGELQQLASLTFKNAHLCNLLPLCNLPKLRALKFDCCTMSQYEYIVLCLVACLMNRCSITFTECIFEEENDEDVEIMIDIVFHA